MEGKTLGEREEEYWRLGGGGKDAGCFSAGKTLVVFTTMPIGGKLAERRTPAELAGGFRRTQNDHRWFSLVTENAELGGVH